MAIRYNKSYNKEIANAVSRYNSKIKRLNADPRSSVNKYIPEPITVKQLKSSLTTRAEMNAKLKSMALYTQRGSEDVFTTTGGRITSKYEQEIDKANLRRAKAYTTKRIHEIEESDTFVGGVKQKKQNLENNMRYRALVVTREALNKSLDQVSEYEHSHFTKVINANLSESIKRKDATFKRNVIEGLRKQGITDKQKLQLAKISEKLSKISDKEFKNLYEKDAAFRKIWDTYYSSGDFVNESKDKEEQQLDYVANNIDKMVKNANS